jgi:spermidine synthase
MSNSASSDFPNLRRIRWTLLCLFFLSGVSALIYQILWIRKLGLLFGVHVFAVSAVLTTFMAGLAFGSRFFGKYADRHGDSLRIFLFLELGIGLFALTFPLSFKLLTVVYYRLLSVLPDNPYQTQIIRFLLSFFYLIFPTVLMGGTLPVLSKFFVRRLRELGHYVGSLYSVNNLGALIGAFLGGFVLIRAVGLNMSVFFAALLNLVNATIVYFARKSSPEPVLPPVVPPQDVAVASTSPHQSPNGHAYSPRVIRIVLWVFAIEGFTTLSYEVVWTRILLGMSFDKSIYFYTTVIMSFICGLSLGGFLVSRFIDRRQNLLGLFGYVQIGIGLAAIFLLTFFAQLHHFLLSKRPFYGEAWLTTLGMEYVLFFLVMLIPTILMGTTFPIVSKLVTESLQRLGKKIGYVGFLDTVGSIVGAFAAGFILVPFLGVVKSVVVTAFLNCIIGIAILVVHPNYTRRLKTFAITVTAGISLFAVFTVPGQKYFRDWQTRQTGDRILFYQEGVSGTVVVPQHPDGTRVLAINGSVTAFADYGDIRVHKMLGYLPFLLHPAPKSALVIGLGMGVTTQSLIQPGIRQVDCVEISPEVVRAAKEVFVGENKNVLDHPKLNTIIEDGRAHLVVTEKKYDIITSNAIHARLSGNLYTKEFYQLCKSKLSPQGVLCQWMSTNWLLESEYKALIKAFVDVFPHTSLWCVNAGHVLLIATPQPLSFDWQAVRKRMNDEKIRYDLEESDLASPFEIFAQFVCDERQLQDYTFDAKINSDNRPYAELSRVVTKAQNPHIIRSMIDFKSDISPFIRFDGMPAFEQEAVIKTLRDFTEAEKLYTEAVLENAFYLNRGKAIALLEEAIALKPDVYRYREELASIFFNSGRSDAAIEQLAVIESLHPDVVIDLIHLGMAYLQNGSAGNAAEMFTKVAALQPENPLARYYLAILLANDGHLDRAAAELKKIISFYPDFAGSYYYLARIYVSQKRFKEARQMYKACLQRDPGYEDAGARLAELEKFLAGSS